MLRHRRQVIMPFLANFKVLAMLKTVITIAGADAGAAAGIQADLRTFQSLGIHGATVITAITAQGLDKQFLAEAVGNDLFRQQLLTILNDFEVIAVKTGMLASPTQVEILTQHLPDKIPLVIDPVLRTSSGHCLINDETLAAMQRLLFQRSWLITPNLPELMSISKLPTGSHVQQARALLKAGCKAVLVKGGHADCTQLNDDLYEFNHLQQLQSHRFSHPKKPGQYRGTGCVLSAAISCYIASQKIIVGQSLHHPCQLGIDYLQNCISNTPTPNPGQAAILRHPPTTQVLPG